MANTYQWAQIKPSGLNSMTVDGQSLSQVFTTLTWQMSGTDGTNTAATIGTVDLGQPNPASFVPAASVTQAILVGWLTTALGAAQIAAVKALIDTQIAVMASPPTFTGTPISNVPC